ncbi:PREDICTED: uncharacterized protein LOC108564734 [Nicrophorus vespilloides]|uniref:Uncharacterized protein LOC108564734 n=1 Tax=Nicrophorus vespilloides TaxID=110193 RepID=A0ABM1MXM9_NICVS|nr:PREDICTED: uncharacterized protein LOC108564734 [Nicrophorus vespilloides]
MSLVPDYEDSSSSSSSSHSESLSDEEITKEDAVSCTETTTLKPKLPTPGFLGATGESVKATTSVFTNPFIEAEQTEEAILEKHVKMVSKKDNVVINGKKVCWNYRKGRCRFGHNCKYAHDSDLQKTKEELSLENRVENTVICQNQELTQPSAQELLQIKNDSTAANQKRKRPGLTQGLVPGKKVMRSYKQQHNKTQ